MIAMSYVDKRYAARGALRDYQTMLRVMEITPGEVVAAYGDMAAPRTPVLEHGPTAHDPLTGELKLAAAIDDMDIMRERYQAAVEYMAWFEPAWKSLSEQERIILREFYMSGSLRSGATARLHEQLGLSLKHVDRLRGRALSRLSILLYGQ